uniref:7TM GPCR serpentine receptor class x (Srx) domain-containing protein n=1 Tax=Strongyloides venezuelensis TaxID=75913 RepID=A0A0K0FPH0_STRVS
MLTLILNTTVNILTIVLCTISLILIYKRWNKDDIFKKYNEMTALQFSLGIVSGIIHIVAKQEVIIDSPYVIWNLDYFNGFGKTINILVIYIVIMSIYINIAMPGVVLISRNWIIIKNKNPKTQSRHLVILILLVVSAVSEIAFSIALCFSMGNEGDHIRKILEKNPFVINYLSPKSLNPTCKLTSVYFMIVTISIVLFFNINYIVFVVQYRNYKKHMNQFDGNMTEKTKKMYYEFTRILCFQSLAPILITGIPVLGFMASIFLRFEAFIFSGATYLFLIICFVPALNAFFFIILPLRNRRIIRIYIRRLFCIKKESSIKLINLHITRIP